MYDINAIDGFLMLIRLLLGRLRGEARVHLARHAVGRGRARQHPLGRHYTRSPLEDSRLFGPRPWKILRYYL